MVPEARVPGVEFDLRVTKDGEPVVFHDPTLKRIAGNRTAIANMSFAELREIDVGSWFGPEFSGERVPHLREVLELLGSSVYYDIELKTVSSTMGALVAGILKEYDLQHRVIVSSFSPRVADHRRVFASMAPILTPSYPLRYLSWRIVHRRSIKPAYLKPDVSFFQRRRVFLRLAEELTKQTIPWIPWTINDPELAKFCIAAGAEGIISDDPSRIAAALGIPLRPAS